MKKFVIQYFLPVRSNFQSHNALSRYTSIRSSSASGTTGHLPLEEADGKRCAEDALPN